MNRPCIVGCGALTALGNLDETWENLKKGQTGLEPLRIDGLDESYPVGLVADIIGEIGSSVRLVNLMKRGIEEGPDLTGIATSADCIVTTTKGAADELLNLSSPPWQGQPWQLGEMAKHFLDLGGSMHIISAACASGTIGLIQAAIQIENGSSTAVIVLGIEIVSRFVVAGFSSLQALSRDPCRPFDRSRSGLSLGEGIGVIIVTSEKFAVRNGWPILARIGGWGVSCDATHITAPCRTGSGLQRVFAEATNGSKTQVGGINAHGTGTLYNDAMELLAIRSFWQSDLPPIHSIKGAVGHCLGAAGVIEAAIAVVALQEGQLPPTIGFDQGEEKNVNVSGSKTLPLTSSSILSCNAGFGGINAGILFVGT